MNMMVQMGVRFPDFVGTRKSLTVSDKLSPWVMALARRALARFFNFCALLICATTEGE